VKAPHPTAGPIAESYGPPIMKSKARSGTVSSRKPQHRSTPAPQPQRGC